MKKLIAIALTLVLCLSVMSVATFAASDKMTVKVTAPAEWEECYVYSWTPEAFGSWPGTKLTAAADGTYSFELSEAVEGMVISAGNSKPQTTDIKDLAFAAGTNATITVGEAGADGKHTYTLGTAGGSTTPTPTEPQATQPQATEPQATQPQATQPTTSGTTGKVTLSIKVPADWTEVYAYSWDANGAATMGDWPGSKVTKSGDWYKGQIAADVTKLIINNGNNGGKQTVDLEIQAGKDVCVTLDGKTTAEGKFEATVTYTAASGSTTTKPQGGQQADPTPQGTPSSYRVVGNAAWMGNWNEANDLGVMIDVGGGVYKKNFENVEPGNYELKITKDGKWDNAYGDGSGNNYTFTVTEKCTITVTFTLKDNQGVIHVKGAGVPSTADVSMISVFVLLALATTCTAVLVINKKKFI